MTSPRSILIGAALAALAPGVCMAIYAFIAATSENEEILDSVIGSLMLCGITSIFSVPPTLIIGVPYLFWLRSNGRLTPTWICSGAALIGATYFALMAWGFAWSNPAPSFNAYLLGAVLGLAGGAGFCLGARPDIPLQPTPHSAHSRFPRRG